MEAIGSLVLSASCYRSMCKQGPAVTFMLTCYQNNNYQHGHESAVISCCLVTNTVSSEGKVTGSQWGCGPSSSLANPSWVLVTLDMCVHTSCWTASARPAELTNC